MADLHDLSALEQGAAIARGEVSSLELTAHYLDRAARHSDEVGAYVLLTDGIAPGGCALPCTGYRCR